MRLLHLTYSYVMVVILLGIVILSTVCSACLIFTSRFMFFTRLKEDTHKLGCVIFYIGFLRLWEVSCPDFLRDNQNAREVLESMKSDVLSKYPEFQS